MKIFITGAAGMLAAEVIGMLNKRGHHFIQTDINQRLPDIQALDVSNLDSVLSATKSFAPDYIFHLGAETNVDLCEQDPAHAFIVNTLGTENIVIACKQTKAKLLYISTGGVFDGAKQSAYTEFDNPNPINQYGQSKLQGEKIIQDQLCEYFIIRAGWMIGGWKLDKKFVYKICQQLRLGKTELNVVSDKFGSPTFTKDFAANLMEVLATNRYGIYHMTNNGACSRYDMAIKIVETMGLSGRVKVNAISSDEYPLPAPRSRSEILNNYKLSLLGLNNMRKWEIALEEYINENKNK